MADIPLIPHHQPLCIRMVHPHIIQTILSTLPNNTQNRIIYRRYQTIFIAPIVLFLLPQVKPNIQLYFLNIIGVVLRFVIIPFFSHRIMRHRQILEFLYPPIKISALLPILYLIVIIIKENIILLILKKQIFPN